MAVYQTHQYVPPPAVPPNSAEANARAKPGAVTDQSSKKIWDDYLQFSRQQNYDSNLLHQNMLANQTTGRDDDKVGFASASANANPQEFASMMSHMFQWMKTYEQQADAMSKRVMSNEDMNALLLPPPPPPQNQLPLIPPPPLPNVYGSAPMTYNRGNTVEGVPYFSRGNLEENAQREFLSSEPFMKNNKTAGSSETRRSVMDVRTPQTSAYSWMRSGFDDNQGTKQRSMSEAYEDTMLGRVVQQHSRLYDDNPRPLFGAPPAFQPSVGKKLDEIPGEYVKSSYPSDVPRVQHGIPIRSGRVEETKDTVSGTKCGLCNWIYQNEEDMKKHEESFLHQRKARQKRHHDMIKDAEKVYQPYVGEGFKDKFRLGPTEIELNEWRNRYFNLSTSTVNQELRRVCKEKGYFSFESTYLRELVISKRDADKEEKLTEQREKIEKEQEDLNALEVARRFGEEKASQGLGGGQFVGGALGGGNTTGVAAPIPQVDLPQHQQETRTSVAAAASMASRPPGDPALGPTMASPTAQNASGAGIIGGEIQEKWMEYLRKREHERSSRRRSRSRSRSKDGRRHHEKEKKSPPDRSRGTLQRQHGGESHSGDRRANRNRDRDRDRDREAAPVAAKVKDRKAPSVEKKGTKSSASSSSAKQPPDQSLVELQIKALIDKMRDDAGDSTGGYQVGLGPEPFGGGNMPSFFDCYPLEDLPGPSLTDFPQYPHQSMQEASPVEQLLLEAKARLQQRDRFRDDDRDGRRSHRRKNEYHHHYHRGAEESRHRAAEERQRTEDSGRRLESREYYEDVLRVDDSGGRYGSDRRQLIPNLLDEKYMGIVMLSNDGAPPHDDVLVVEPPSAVANSYSNFVPEGENFYDAQQFGYAVDEPESQRNRAPVWQRLEYPSARPRSRDPNDLRNRLNQHRRGSAEDYKSSSGMKHRTRRRSRK